MAACADPSMKAQLDWETPTKSLEVLLEAYIERKIAEKFNTDFIIDELYNMKECRARLR